MANHAWRFFEFASGQKPCSLNEEAAHTENIEVFASHVGLGVNPLALLALTDRLGPGPGKLAPLRPAGCLALVDGTRPRPAGVSRMRFSE